MPHKLSVQIIAVIADIMEMDPSEVSPESHFLEDLGASSLDIAELIWRLEDDPRFSLGEIPDEAIEDLVRVRDLISLLEELVPPPPISRAGSRRPVVIAADHTGYALKSTLVGFLESQGVKVRDMGTDDRMEVDFPGYAEAVARLIAAGQAECGILIGATGIGMSIAANKVKGARAATVHNLLEARLSRQRYDVNILCLGASLIGDIAARHCVEEFLSARFEPGRDGRWTRQLSSIHEIENLP